MPFIPATLVRCVATPVLAIGILLLYIVATNYHTLGVWTSIGIGFSGVSISGGALMSLITADPAWIMLDLIWPY